MANANAAENINVLVRFRPLNDVEKDRTGTASPISFLADGRTVEARDAFHNTTLTFSYNRVFCPDSTQEELYDHVGPSILQAVTKGINAAVIAYGQTGSGKTHTMFGKRNEFEAGFIPRFLEALFHRVQNPNINEVFQATVSFIQIYRENIMDLLSPNIERCQIREDRRHGLWITDALTLPVATAQDVMDVMVTGDRRRVVAATQANADSSRSHTVFIISLTNRHTFENTETFAQMYLVDLAGSECVEKTGSEGERLEEAKCINTSLLALRNVISALVNNKSHIPYRDSKITRLLQNSFGGNSKTFLIVCCSPAAYNFRETLSSLRFGNSSGRIQNRPTQNVMRTVEELTKLLQRTADDIIKARVRIVELQKILTIQEAQLRGEGEDGRGDVLGGIYVERDDTIPEHFLCPLTGRPMVHPVVAMDGYTYDEAALLEYFRAHNCTPTGSITDTRYLPNDGLKQEWAEYISAHGRPRGMA